MRLYEVGMLRAEEEDQEADNADEHEEAETQDQHQDQHPGLGRPKPPPS